MNCNMGRRSSGGRHGLNIAASEREEWYESRDDASGWYRRTSPIMILGEDAMTT